MNNPSVSMMPPGANMAAQGMVPNSGGPMQPRAPRPPSQTGNGYSFIQISNKVTLIYIPYCSTKANAVVAAPLGLFVLKCIFTLFSLNQSVLRFILKTHPSDRTHSWFVASGFFLGQKRSSVVADGHPHTIKSTLLT